MPVNYSFVKSEEELSHMRKQKRSNFFQQEEIQAFWTVDETVARRVLPPHVEPYMPFGKPVVLAYVAYFGRPEFYYPYTEGGLFLLAECNGTTGAYCLAMPLDGSDQAQDCGREFYGYPKKTAWVKLERRGDKVFGEIIRNDVKIFKIEATLNKPFNDPELGAIAIGGEELGVESSNCFLLKFDLDTNRDGEMDFYRLSSFKNMRIQAQMNETRFLYKKSGFVDSMEFQPSEDDPWVELAPRSGSDVFGALFSKYETYMGASKDVYVYKPEEYDAVEPYLFLRFDTQFFGKEHSSHRCGNFQYH